MMKKETNDNGFVKRVVLPPPDLADNTADAERLLRALKKECPGPFATPDMELARSLPAILRKHRWRVKCLCIPERGRTVLAGCLGGESERIFAGVAVDLGTTKIVMRLIDMESKKRLAEVSFDNPQAEVGPDVLTRIRFAESEEGLERMSRFVVAAFNDNIKFMCDSCGVATSDVMRITVAGNTAMTHFFLKLDPSRLIREPYIPVVNSPGTCRASELGIRVNPLAAVFVFPNAGSYFGGDLIAGILFSGIYREEAVSVLVDVGTNAEVVVGNRDWLMGCAGAAGPALEGGIAKAGMSAAPGVIDRIAWVPESRGFEFRTIGSEKPRGICGSAMIDLMAQLFLHGMLDIRGRIVKEKLGDRWTRQDEIPAVVVVEKEKTAAGEELTVSQPDINNFISSKAAMFTILETVAVTLGMTLDDIENFFVAGTFGSLINPDSAISIGMLPDIDRERYRSLGNSSLKGAEKALTSPCHETIDRIRDMITYLELNVNQDFMNRFSAAKFLPHTERSRFPSVRVMA